MLFRWVPAEWLTQWANSADSVPFQRDALLCKDHGKLDPNKVTGRLISPAKPTLPQESATIDIALWCTPCQRAQQPHGSGLNSSACRTKLWQTRKAREAA